MGDYTKLIVNCSVKKMTEEETKAFEQEVRDKIGIGTSAYQCGGELIQLNNDWDHRTDLTLVTQCKYSRGIDEFIEWLKPQVIQGMGEEEAFSLSFTEYDIAPKVYYKENYEL